MALFGKDTERGEGIDVQNRPQAVRREEMAVEGRGDPSRSVPASAGGQTYLDPGCKVVGKLFFEGPARIDGQVEGEVFAREAITIGEKAVVAAHVKAGSIVAAGSVRGDLTATKRIELKPSAKVAGNLATPVLVIEEGATFDGRCSMQGNVAQTGAAPTEQKTAAQPKAERPSVVGTAEAKPRSA